MERVGEDARFWSKVDRRGPDECWEWQAHRSSPGYGTFWFRGRTASPHRVALVLSGVELVPGMVVRHVCDNPPCCNPRHLRAGSQSENIIDMYAKGRANVPAGQRHHHGVKTHCPKGHPYDETNTYWRKTPWGRGRACLICKRTSNREFMRGRKARWNG